MEQLTAVLAATLKEIKEASFRSSGPVSSIEIPKFCPSDNDGANKWCDEVEKLGETFQWSSFEQLTRAASGLLGEAKHWYNKWQPIEKSWDNFRSEICSLYPPKRNLSEKFRNASLYTSRRAASYCEYARTKISLLQSLNFDLTEKQLLELVIGDLDDIHVKTAAFNSNPQSICSLLTLLDNYEVAKPGTSNFSNNKLKRPFSNTLNTNNSNLKSEKLCYICRKPGHLQRQCPENMKFNSKQIESKTTFAHSQIICNFCHKMGHTADKCFNKISYNKRKYPNINNFTIELDQNCCTEFIIQNINVKCLIDTGAECSLLSKSVAGRLCCRLEPSFTLLRGIGNHFVSSLVKTTLNIENNGTAFQITFCVVDSTDISFDAILGRDLLSYPGVKICTDFTGTRIYLESHDLTVDTVSINSFANVSNHINTPLEGESFERLKNLLDKFSANITTGNSVSAVKTAELEIKLSEDRIICYRPYRMPLSEREILKTIIDDLLKNKIIRESTSPYASPVILVHKKDGTARLCCDYRAINKITIKDKWPIPRIDEQLDRLGQNKYFITLDMASGFHQIPVAENSIEKTAFVTPDGHYEYLRVPFGLSNAPAVFQRAICNALGKLRDTDCLIYLDDILITSMTIPEGLSKLERVLTALAAAGFSLNIKKCRFFETTIDYLGQEISASGVRPGHLKVNALLNAPDPRNVKEVRQFMGLAGYFRKYIPEFSSRTACITNLTKNDVKFSWGVEQEIAKSYVCAFLSQRPLLAVFDAKLETELHTDASSIGYGAILFQRHGKELKVVSYFSRRASYVESKYHSYELETLAVFYSVKHFRIYLTGIPFKLVTDCNSLKLTQNKKDLLPRIARWWCFLQTFDFQIEYRKGKHIPHVDYLSRNPIKPAPTRNISAISTDNWLKINQSKDPKTQEIIEKLREGQLTKDYFCQNDILFRKINPGQNPPMYRAFVPKGSRLGLLRLFHDEQCHIGVDKTFAKINHYFWFPGMAKFVRKYCNHCLKCIASKQHSGPKQGFLHSIDKIPVPFHTIHADCVGPFPESVEGYKHLLLLIDGFTKYIFLVPLKSLSGAEMCNQLKIYLNIFGNTVRFVSDRGTNFTDRSVKELLTGLNINQHLIAKSAPRGNGQVERYVSTVLNLLRTEIKNKAEWPNVVAKLQHTLNSTVQKSTGFSPFYLLTGRNGDDNDIQALTNQFAATLENNPVLERDRKLAYERMKQQADYSKILFDKKRKNANEIKVGDFVYHPSGNSHLAKLERKYDGPFEVVAILPNERFELKNLSTNKKRVVAIDMIRTWPGEFSEDTI